MQLDQLGLYLHTARHLSARQIAFQCLKRVRRPSRAWLQEPRSVFRAPRVRAAFLSRWWGTTAWDPESPVYTFLNRTASIQRPGSPTLDWEYSAHGGLWLDNLHYLRVWDSINPPLSGPLSTALTNVWSTWCAHVAQTPGSKALNPPFNASERAFVLGKFLLRHPQEVDTPLGHALAQGVMRDLNHVAQTLEFHLDGNHLLKNLMSLAWGACLFQGPDAQRWQRIVDRTLEPALASQVLPDGMHYERSPMYHNVALLDLLDVLNVAPEGSWRDRLTSVARRMTAASRVVTHPDGDIALFNDAALDAGPRSADLIAYAESLLGPVSRPDALPEAGFYLLNMGPHIYAIADLGPLGPDEQMGHAHSDLFSFELSAFGQRVFVNGGTSTYYDAPFRQHERSEHAHNTVAFALHRQCEHWSNFRVARRARPTEVTFASNAQGTSASGAVTLIGPAPRATHTRRFLTRATGELSIEDLVCHATGGAQARFHLAPAVRIDASELAQDKLTLRLPDQPPLNVSQQGGRLQVEDCWVAQRFNDRRASQRVVLSLPPLSGHSRLQIAVRIAEVSTSPAQPRDQLHEH